MARRRGEGAAAWLAGATLVAPLLFVLAATAGRFGWLDMGVARELLVLRIGPFVALAGVIAALLSVVLTLRQSRKNWLAPLAGVVIAAVSAGGYVMQQRGAVAGDNDVSSDPADPPGFNRAVAAARNGQRAIPVADMSGACRTAPPLPTQVAPQVAVAALEENGFTVLGAAPFRAEGMRIGFWFGLTHDATIRIRPGRTDVRVTARYGGPQGDEACRLATAIVDSMVKASS